MPDTYEVGRVEAAVPSPAEPVVTVSNVAAAEAVQPAVTRATQQTAQPDWKISR